MSQEDFKDTSRFTKNWLRELEALFQSLLEKREKEARVDELQTIGKEGWSDEDSILAEYLDMRLAALTKSMEEEDEKGRD